VADDKIQEKLQELVNTLDVREDSARGVVSVQNYKDVSKIYSVAYNTDRDGLRDAYTLFTTIKDAGLANGRVTASSAG
jgi:hypothetical protein